jgi:hypothetical protein
LSTGNKHLYRYTLYDACICHWGSTQDSDNLIQLSPLLECDPTVFLPEKSKVTPYKYLESDLIKDCHMIFIHSLGQPVIIRSHSKVHRSRGNPKEIPTWASTPTRVIIGILYRIFCIRHQVIEYLRLCENIRYNI